ncbi:hypothetical protein N0V86_000008 [Didymella sp. IMI 355093]|nr:hypothetical protein N0V86_000008 [Didymella sp. IMI 355093]
MHFIRVNVSHGDNLNSFHIYADLLTSRSEFFKKALSRAWKEAEERKVDLPEVDTAVFKLYLNHIYTGELAVIPVPLPKEHKNMYVGVAEKKRLAELYVLAKLLQDVKCKNAVLKAFIASTYTKHPDGEWYTPGSSIVHIIYSGTPDKSLMRRFVVDLYTEFAEEGWVVKASRWPTDFIHELTLSPVALLTMREKTEGWHIWRLKKLRALEQRYKVQLRNQRDYAGQVQTVLEHT